MFLWRRWESLLSQEKRWSFIGDIMYIERANEMRSPRNQYIAGYVAFVPLLFCIIYIKLFLLF